MNQYFIKAIFFKLLVQPNDQISSFVTLKLTDIVIKFYNRNVDKSRLFFNLFI